MAAAGSTVIVKLSGESVTHNDPGIAKAGIVFRADGTVDKATGVGVYTQIDNLTDWIQPNGAASGSYEVRCTGRTGDVWTGSAAADESWIAISTDREWNLTETGGGILGNNCTFEIRLGSTTLTSGSYDFTADNT